MTQPAIAPAPAAQPKDFADMVTLLEKLTETENALGQLTSEMNVDYLAHVRLNSDRYKELQTAIGAVDAALKVIGERNPQWFEEKKTLTTPYGTLKRTTSISLEIADPAVSITLIKAAKREEDFLDVKTTIRKEAMENLTDEELAKFGIKRVTEHNFKPEPATIDLGKAVKAADKSAAAAAKTAKKAREI